MTDRAPGSAGWSSKSGASIGAMTGSGSLVGLSPVWAVVPLRGLRSAKTRLAPELDPDQRRALVVDMAGRTLGACRDARTVAGTVLVTLDPAAARLAEAWGARTIVQHLPGLNDAIREGRTLAMALGARSILVLPIDLVRISPAAIDAVVASAAASAVADGPSRVVALVPDRHGTGTNALLVSPPDAIEPAFGVGSHALHRLAALDRGLPLVELGGPLTLDVDTPSDLLAALDTEDDQGARPLASAPTVDG